MTRQSDRRKLKWLQPTDNLPEMNVEDCRRLFLETFHVGSVYVEGSNDNYRFAGDGCNEFVPETPARTVHATRRGLQLTFDPITIINLLEKFDRSEEEFKSAYNAMFASPPSNTIGPSLDNITIN
jgi:hypothetical protein